MTRATSLLIAVYGLPVSLIVLAIPLILKWVPPNPFYGYRMSPAFDSTEQWYRANGIAGRYMLGTGLVCLVANVLITAGWERARDHRQGLIWIAMGNSLVLLLAILMAAARVKHDR